MTDRAEGDRSRTMARTMRCTACGTDRRFRSLKDSIAPRRKHSVAMWCGYCCRDRWHDEVTLTPEQRCRVIGAPRPPPVADGQDALFSLPEITAS